MLKNSILFINFVLLGHSELLGETGNQTDIQKIFMAVNQKSFSIAYDLIQKANCGFFNGCKDYFDVEDPYGDSIQVHRDTIRSLISDIELAFAECPKIERSVFEDEDYQNPKYRFQRHTQEAVSGLAYCCSPKASQLGRGRIIGTSGSRNFCPIKDRIEKIRAYSGEALAIHFEPYEEKVKIYESNLALFQKTEEASRRSNETAQMAKSNSPAEISNTICQLYEMKNMAQSALNEQKEIEKIGGVEDLRKKRLLAEQIYSANKIVELRKDEYKKAAKGKSWSQSLCGAVSDSKN